MDGGTTGMSGVAFTTSARLNEPFELELIPVAFTDSVPFSFMIPFHGSAQTTGVARAGAAKTIRDATTRQNLMQAGGACAESFASRHNLQSAQRITARATSPSRP